MLWLNKVIDSLCNYRATTTVITTTKKITSTKNATFTATAGDTKFALAKTTPDTCSQSLTEIYAFKRSICINFTRNISTYT